MTNQPFDTPRDFSTRNKPNAGSASFSATMAGCMKPGDFPNEKILTSILPS